MREMKDSGIAWIGEIPRNWILKKGKFLFKQRNTRGNAINLELLSPTQRYGVISQGEYEKLTGMKAVKLKEKTDLSQLKTIHNGDYCISLRSFQGGFEFCTNEGVVSPAYQVFYAQVSTKPSYYKYLFKNDAFISKMNSFTMSLRDGKNIAFSDFGNTLIPYPPLLSQQAIADFLDAKCADIDSLTVDIQKQINILKEYKKSVITQAVTKGLDPNVEMKDSGIAWCPRIPKHWNPINPKVLFTLRTDRAKQGQRQLTASQKYGIIYQDEFMEKESQKVVTVIKDFSILKQVKPNDFVISMRSFQGGLEYSALSGSISSAYVMLIPNSHKVYPRFYRYFFKSSKYINAIQSTSNLVRDGQAMRYSNFAQVYLFDIPMEEQKKITDYLDNKIPKIDAIISGKQKQLDILKEYKKSLIYEYVTGKKEVPCHE